MSKIKGMYGTHVEHSILPPVQRKRRQVTTTINGNMPWCLAMTVLLMSFCEEHNISPLKTVTTFLGV